MTAKPRNPEAMARVEAFVRAGIDVLAKMARPEDRSERHFERWLRVGDLAFLQQTGEEPTWSYFVIRNDVMLRGLPEYQAALDALDADPVIGPQLNGMVGHPAIGGGTIQKEYYLIHYISIVARTAAELPFDEERFRTEFLKREAEFHRDTVELLMLAPIAGLSALDAPVRLHDDLEIDRFTEDEAGYLLDARLLQRIGTHHGDVAYTTTNCGVRRRLRLPKVVGSEHFTTMIGADAGVVPRFDEEAIDALQALRVHKTGVLWLPGVLQIGRELGRGTSLMWSIITPRHGGSPTTYSVTARDAPAIQAHWQDLTDPNVERRVFLQTALRRFGYGIERSRTEDRLIDLMIAAEALYLTEFGARADRGDLAYRIAVRCAFFADMPSTSRRTRYEDMRLAYRARSNLVHGGTLPKELETEEKLQAFSSTIEEYVRAGLKPMLGLAKQSTGDDALVDWDALIVGKP